MTDEITVLALGCILLVTHIILATHYKTQQYGKTWNMGARDEDMPALGVTAGRLKRAQDNFLETFPIAIAAFLALSVTGKASDLTAIAAWVWLGARVVYLPLYWAGVPVVRTIVFAVSLLALLACVLTLLFG